MHFSTARGENATAKRRCNFEGVTLANFTSNLKYGSKAPNRTPKTHAQIGLLQEKVILKILQAITDQRGPEIEFVCARFFKLFSK